jgi:hypothetical protein
VENNISTGQTQGIWIQGDLEALVSRMRIEKQGGEAEGKANQQSSFFGSIPDDTLQQYFEAQSRRHQQKSNQHHLLEHLMREHRPHRQKLPGGADTQRTEQRRARHMRKDVRPAPNSQHSPSTCASTDQSGETRSIAPSTTNGIVVALRFCVVAVITCRFRLARATAGWSLDGRAEWCAGSHLLHMRLPARTTCPACSPCRALVSHFNQATCR